MQQRATAFRDAHDAGATLTTMRRWGERRGATSVVALAGLTLLSGCGLLTASPVVASNANTGHARVMRTIWVPKISWYPVSVGSPTLLDEGSQVSSVLEGPDQRIYYGTENPLGNANVLGWYNPATGSNHSVSVPPATPPFPANSGLNNLSVSQSASWGGVSLVVSGKHNVWYRHWGYVGGWSSVTGQFIAGDYAIPGPTVTEGHWTASITTTFSGASDVKLMDLSTHHVTVRSLPSGATPVALSMQQGQTGHPILWLLTNQTVWSLPWHQTSWQPIASLTSGNFFVAMGRWGQALWAVDADGNIDRVTRANGLTTIATVSVSPLHAVSAPKNGLWIVSPHRISLWEPHNALKSWSEPTSPYGTPASTWATNGPNEPPNWPPTAHLARGPQGTAIVGEGTWVGEASLVPERVPAQPRRPST